MRKEIFMLLYLLSQIVIGCNRESENEKVNILKYWNSEKCSMYSNSFAKERDSVEIERIYERMSSKHYTKEKIRIDIFAKSTVELIDVDKKFKNYDIDRYKSCEIMKDDTILTIRLMHQSKYNDLSIDKLGEKEVLIKLNLDSIENRVKNFYSFIDTGRSEEEAKDIIYYESLVLNKSMYDLGDTICGKISLRGKLKDARIYMVEGRFKAIVKRGINPIRFRKDKDYRKRILEEKKNE